MLDVMMLMCHYWFKTVPLVTNLCMSYLKAWLQPFWKVACFVLLGVGGGGGGGPVMVCGTAFCLDLHSGALRYWKFTDTQACAT